MPRGAVDRVALDRYLFCSRSWRVYASFVAVLAIPPSSSRSLVRRRALEFARRSRRWSPALLRRRSLVLAVRRGSGQLFWVPRPNLVAALQVLESLTSSGLQPSFQLTSTSIVLLCVTSIVLLSATLLVSALAALPASRAAASGVPIRAGNGR